MGCRLKRRKQIRPRTAQSHYTLVEVSIRSLLAVQLCECRRVRNRPRPNVTARDSALNSTRLDYIQHEA